MKKQKKHLNKAQYRGNMAGCVLLYWPNVVDYCRLFLVFAAWFSRDAPAVFIPLYLAFVLLDDVDGWLARRLGQTSRFGAWLDVAVDNVGRGMLWSLLFEWGWLLSSLEWCVFVCNHSRAAEEWKTSFSRSPRLIQAIMANNFHSPLGMWVVGGLHYLPLCVYGLQTGAWTRWLGLSTWTQAVVILVLAAGRLLALYAEIWCVWTHVDQLIRNQPVEKQS